MMMGDIDPYETQPGVDSSITSSLSSLGFDSAHEIGRGGFGVVYRCTETSLDRTVAVKVLTSALITGKQERFIREQRAMGHLTGHPNIVSPLQVGVTDSGDPFIVMPYYQHGSVDARIRRDGPLSPEEVLRLGVKLAGALETAHSEAIIHRDVKPANILFTDYGEPILTDFGIARVPGGFETETGVMAGSPAFTAPEVLAGAPPTSASDIYGLGATLFCAISGHSAFERRTGEQVVAHFVRITSERAPDLRDEGVPNDIAGVIERAMSPNPTERHASAAALGEDLRRLQRRRNIFTDEMAIQRPQIRGTPYADSEAPELIAAKAPPRRRGNLPLELSSFIGRKHELIEARNLLESTRLLTLVGIGGVGKTRLAVQLATRVQRTFADGTWFVALDEVHTPARLIEAMATTMGLRDWANRSTREILFEFLSAPELLLVLDNCEQVVGFVAELANDLLQHNSKLRILATSREPLGIFGEATMRVPPLSVPDPTHEPSLQRLAQYDSISLFTERATNVVTTFSLSDSNKTAVTRICHRLDGLPLPIELAAARLRAMSPDQILERLSDRFDLLTAGNRNAPSRQQTLKLCVDWSYELCTPGEQLAWKRLSIFSGSFDLDAAEYVCDNGTHPDTLLDSITSLVDKSILIREEHGVTVRFRMLQTIRSYGRTKARQAGVDKTLKGRHRDWFSELIGTAEHEFISKRQLEWVARFSSEQANLTDALQFCVDEQNSEMGLRIVVSSTPFWGSLGLLGETKHWLDEFLTEQIEHPTLVVMKALYAGCAVAEQQRDHKRGSALAELARTLSGQMADPLSHGIAEYTDGLVGLFDDDLTRARSGLERALAIFEPSENLRLVIETLTWLGLTYQLLDRDPSRAIGCYESILTITADKEESVYRSYALWAQAISQWRSGTTAIAHQQLQEGLRLAHLIGDPMSCANCLEALAWTVADIDPQRAGTLMGVADTLGQITGSPSVFAFSIFDYHEECERKVRLALTEHGFETAWGQGTTLDLDSAVSFALGESTRERPPPGSTILTKRELEIAELITEGLTNKAIAARLVISLRTVQGHVEHILTKLGFTSRAQVAAWVVEERQLP